MGSQGPRGYYRGTMSWRREVGEILVQLEDQRKRLEEVRERAKRQGGPEGERLEAQTEARLRDIEQRIDDLRASLE
jgi:DNA-binding PadR family transcriptional regulator